MRKIKVIEIDETPYLTGFEDKIKRFWAVSFFDPDRVVRYCSYWERLYLLHALYFNFEAHEHVPEEDREAIDDELWSTPDIISTDYANVEIITDLINSGKVRCVELEFADDATDDDVREHLCGNHVL